jgi:thiazole/oxazole-forming peptide maturase SagD family component
MNKTSIPYLNAHVVICDSNITFYTSETAVTLEAPKKLIRQLIRFCNGLHSYVEIIEKLSIEWNNGTVADLIECLFQNKVLIDVRHLSEEIWRVVKNPLKTSNLMGAVDAIVLASDAVKRHCYHHDDITYQIQESVFGDLLKKRKSVRSFTGELIAFHKLIQILWSAYGWFEDGTVLHKTVPSAGALYPLILHVVLFKQTETYLQGIYKVYLGSSKTLGFELVSSDINSVQRSFLDPLMLENAHGVIVVSGSFDVAAEKYGNRSLLYVPLEAGHVAQNIHLSAVENDVATVEIGGFLDSVLAKSINLSETYNPLVTVVFGLGDDGKINQEKDSDIEVEWAVPKDDTYSPPFAIVSAKANIDLGWSNGRDVSPICAHVKAIAEAKEWAACGNISDKIIRARFEDLKSAIDPRSIVGFHKNQYRLKDFPFKSFDNKTEYEWVECFEEKNGSAGYILADLVHFPYYPKTPYYAFANSSGVAAHPNRLQAVMSSTLELIERDSFMIAYLTKIEFPTICNDTLPIYIQNRIDELQEVGFNIYLIDHSIDLAPVVCVFAQNKDMNCTTCASCSHFDVEYAVSHALMEVEAFVAARLQNGKSKSISPQEVSLPLDHGRLYEQKKYYNRADFLIQGKTIIDFNQIGINVSKTWFELMNILDQMDMRLFTVPLHYISSSGNRDKISVVRSIIPGLVPMTFGYRHEPGAMERIYTVAFKFLNKKLSYNELTKFPHPFA